jgi:(E)-4-hydroxy-3-methylbut-2-enyl-diphosphate synthase
MRSLWNFTASPTRTLRRRTREVRVGDVGIGGHNPIRLQSMTISDTLDTASLLDEIEALWHAGSELVRVTAPNRKCAEHLGVVRAAMRRRGIDVPLVADIHFTPQAAWIAAEHVEKVRINPGNFADRKHFKKWEYSDAEYEEELERLDAAFSPLVLRCRETGTAMRIGTNHGSLSDRILNRYGDTPEGMVESAIEFVRICERHGFHDIVLSMKASDVKVMIQAYRLLAARMATLGMDYPFHLGVTEAGSGFPARVKSSIGIGTLLQDGIGDTVRVSLTEDSVHELPVCRDICAPFQECFTRAAPAPGAAAPPEEPPPIHPVAFARRPTDGLGSGVTRLATDWPPRIEVVVRLDDETAFERLLDLPETADRLLFDTDDVGTARAVWRQRRQRLQSVRPQMAAGLQVPAPQALLAASLVSADMRLALRVQGRDLAGLPEGLDGLQVTNLQYTLEPDMTSDADTGARFFAMLQDGRLPPGAVLLRGRGSATLAQAWRRFLTAAPGLRSPILLQVPAEGPLPGGSNRLHEAMGLGAVLVDGLGDALQLAVGPDPAATIELAREILQATRLRLSVADFIACPSCGRTQFDLQTTSARIQERFRHLEGLKIAIMGCIVNGPGEMADADFGYVGSGPGRIDLYVGHERVERGLPEAQAVDRLADLIRAHGRWLDPAPTPGASHAPERIDGNIGSSARVSG